MSMFQRCLGLKIYTEALHDFRLFNLTFIYYLFFFFLSTDISRERNENCIGLYANRIVSSNGYTCTKAQVRTS